MGEETWLPTSRKREACGTRLNLDFQKIPSFTRAGRLAQHPKGHLGPTA